MQRKCQVYPMMIQKSLRIDKRESMLTLEFTVTNLSNNALEYHYSGHNTLNVNPSLRIVFPPEVTKVKCGMVVTDRLGNLSDEIAWPRAVDRSGKDVDISKLGQPCDGTGENLYTPKLKDAWCAAFNESRKEAIGFWFEAEKVPYILVWINCGGYGGYYHIALEPSTGRTDNLEVAVSDWKNFAAIQPRAKISWTEKIFLNHNIKHIERVAPDKGIVQ